MGCGCSAKPGLALVTILSLALEIGASAAIFSSADALAPPAPVPHASGLLTLRSQLRREGNAMFSLAELSHPDYEDLRIRSQSFAGLAPPSSWGFAFAAEERRFAGDEIRRNGSSSEIPSIPPSFTSC